jgi:hypothetical protein
MAAKKTATKTSNKSAFVRSLPATMSGKDVVKKAKEAGLSISLAYVYGIRSKSAAKAGAPQKRGPGRPPRSATSARAAGRTTGLEAMIEAIVAQKVEEVLKGKLGGILA